VKLALLEELLAARRERAAVAVVTELGAGAQKLMLHNRCAGELELSEQELARVHQVIEEDRSQLLQLPGRELFVEVWSNPVRLLIVGAVHVAQALVPIAQLMGLDVVVIDPRASFASEARFPGTNLMLEWPDSAIAKLQPDRRTAVVTLTHNPRFDDAALMAALRSDAFYIGALGSRRTHEQRRQRLAQAGFDDITQRRIRAPIGLAIGASTPSEIALAIGAELVAVLRSAPAAVRS
jgi:xanthine dehydrogenase accessory factor